jgi:divalent metal cation (Fe/Co/Zn/Cd) transporter
MSRQQWLSIVGVWVMVFLFLGFPAAWDKIIALVTGLLVIFISFKMSSRNIHKNSESAYIENGGNDIEKPIQ